MRVMQDSAYVGSLIGTAVGDALGLPYEGLSPRRVARLYPDTSRHHLLPGRGMVSDDTEHACFAALALLRAGDDLAAFEKALARSLRWWLAALPAGTGLATGRAILKLWLGVPPARSGVFSAGNGPAMRAPILGVALGHDPARLKAFVGASTGMTHRDPKARIAALAVALAAWLSGNGESGNPRDYQHKLEALLSDEEAGEFLELVARAARSASTGETVGEFAESIGSRNGVSGYSYHTVPCVLQAWFMYPNDYAAGLQALIRAGGDTDTAGAIFGGIAGAGTGKQGIPQRWLEGIAEWPKSIRWIEALGEALSAHSRMAPKPIVPRYFWPAVLPRNLVFLTIVLTHGFRRLLPPY
jgi:ADP-ribosylglycohydrolase